MNLLILEDDDFFQKYHEKILEKHIERIFQCTNIKDAFETLSNNEIDLFIVDLYLHKESGFEFINTIREKGYIQKVIICSSEFSNDIQNEAKKCGITDIVKRPFNINDILASLCVDK